MSDSMYRSASIDDRMRSVNEKYEVERQKRLRRDGLSQYARISDRLPKIAYDPFNPIEQREPKRDHVTFAFVGGGFSGLVTCARLREVGINDIRIIDRAGDFGGTWYWNRYPGAQCDTASTVYMPLLEETNYIPTEKYAHAPEILAHCRRIGLHYCLYEHALFHTDVTGLSWSARDRVWHVATNRGDDFTAQYVGLGIGELHIPKVPDVPGVERFEGRSIHTSRWDLECAGGDPGGRILNELSGKRVGVIGTGATAVQCVPELARAAGELFVFQRTPSAVFARGNHKIDRTLFAATLQRGWQKRMMANFAANRSDLCPEEDLVDDGWTSISRDICARASDFGSSLDQPGAMTAAENEINFQYMENVRRRIDITVVEQATAEKLKPWYGLFCKRPCFHDDYLETFNSPTVHLIDTGGKGIDRIVETGIVAGGKMIELDSIIYASGFEAWTPYVHRLGFDPVGRKGIKLSAHWRDGVRTLHGIHIHGFPNLFVIDPTQGASLFSNITHNICSSAEAIAEIVKYAREKRARSVEVSLAAEKEWVQLILSGDRLLGSSHCTPGRYNYEGQALGRAAQLNAGYPAGASAFFDYLSDWCCSGSFRGLLFG